MVSLTLKFDQHPEAQGRLKDAIDAGNRKEVQRLIDTIFEGPQPIKIKYSTTHTTELLPTPMQTPLFELHGHPDPHRN